MTSIDFYFNAGDRLGVACRLAGKALQKKNRVLIYAPQAEVAQTHRPDAMDRAGGLVHSALRGARSARRRNPGADRHRRAPPAPHCEVLLNLSDSARRSSSATSACWKSSAQDDEERAGRAARYAFYRDRGYAIRNHDLAKAGP